MAKEIPGFYFNEQKHKYYKIQPNHIAPKDSKYSKEAVDIEKEATLERKRDALYLAQQQRSRIQHSRIFEHPLGGSFSLQRELGISSDANAHNPYKSWARGLEKGTVLEVAGHNDIGQFLVDEETGTLIYGLDDCKEKAISLYAYIPGMRSRLPIQKPIECGFKSRIISVSISPSRMLLAATLGGAAPPSMILAKLIHPEVFRPGDPDQDPFRSPIVADTSAMVWLKPNMYSTNWASAAKNHPTITTFAVATGGGVVLIEPTPESVVQHGHFYAGVSDYEASDTLAVDWLDQNVVVSGCRNGQVRLWDTRSNGTSARMQHSSTITHARRLNEHMIVVAGLRHQLRTYDLRFPHSTTPNALTTPYTTFPTYKNWTHLPSPGLDVHDNLIAAGTSDARIKIFDWKSGEELQTGLDREVPRLRQTSRCVRFQHRGGCGGGLRVLWSGESMVRALAWG